jgi:hypothetical protein
MYTHIQGHPLAYFLFPRFIFSSHALFSLPILYFLSHSLLTPYSLLTLSLLSLTRTSYNKLKDEVDEHHTESDANLSEMYTRIGDLEAKVSGLEAERKQLLLQLKTKDSQLGIFKNLKI